MGHSSLAGATPLNRYVPECHALIKQLLERVQALEERINLDSNNSSKPPSSDGPGRPNRAQRRASTKKRGAQPGHKGHSRSMVEESEVDRIHDCRPQSVWYVFTPRLRPFRMDDGRGCEVKPVGPEIG